MSWQIRILRLTQTGRAGLMPCASSNSNTLHNFIKLTQDQLEDTLTTVFTLTDKLWLTPQLLATCWTITTAQLKCTHVVPPGNISDWAVD